MDTKRYYEKLDGDYDVSYRESTALHNLNYHIHDRLEITFVISEGIWADVDEHVFPVPQYSLLLFGNMDLHRVKFKKGTLYQRYVLWFSPEYLSCFLEGGEELMECFYFRPFANPWLLPVGEKGCKELQMLFERLCQESDARECGGDVLCRLLTGEILVLVNRYYRAYHDIKGLTRSPGFNAACKMIQYIHGHLDEKLTLDELAGIAYVGKRNLNTLFRQTTGFPPGKYILNCRIMKAKTLLVKGVSVDDTCYLAGFGNLSHFIRIFHQYTGMTPKQYALKNSCQR